jgi:hydrogenase maturation protease
MSARRWLVLGLGNRLAGADGFGPAVIERLHEANDLPERVGLRDAHTDLLGQLHHFADYDGVVLVDAVLGSTRGVTVIEERTFAQWEDGSPGAHELSPIMAVRLFRALQKTNKSRPEPPAPTIILVAYCVGEDDFAAPPGHETIEAGVNAVRAIIGAAQSSTVRPYFRR